MYQQGEKNPIMWVLHARERDLDDGKSTNGIFLLAVKPSLFYLQRLIFCFFNDLLLNYFMQIPVLKFLMKE